MKFLQTLLCIVISFSAFSQGAQRLTDNRAGELDGITDDVRVLTTYDNTIVYLDNFDGSRKVFVSDGTEEGTMQIMDLGSGGWIRSVHSIGDYLYANGEVDSLEEQQLFKISKADFSTEIVLKEWESIYYLNSFDGVLYFSGEENNFDNHLYKYTPETGLAEQIFEVYWFGGIEGIQKFKDDIYVMYWNESDDKIHLAKTNGEVGNKEIIKKFPDDGVYYDMLMTPADDYMFFWFRSPTNVFSLYKTDGNEEGTKVLNTDFESISFYDFNERRGQTTVGNKLLYRARLNDTGNRPEFYATDADTETTVTLNLAMDADVEAEPEFFVDYNGKTYVRAIYQQFFNSSYAIYETDGTINGTNRIHNTDQMPEGYFSDGFWMTVHDDKIYHTAWTDEHGREIWATEGTTASNTRKTDIVPGDLSPWVSHLTSTGENLFFFAEDEAFGRELYVYSNNISSTDDEYVGSEIEIYPNPAGDFIMLEDFETFRNMNYSIYNTTGQKVKQGTISENNISTESLPNATYILVISTESGLATSRFGKG